MGQALSKWIDGSLAALEGIESERDKHAAKLAITRRSAATHREALADLDREMKKLIAERERHASKLLELDREVKRDTETLEAIETDLSVMATALEKVAGSDAPASRPRPAPRAQPRPSPRPVSGAIRSPSTASAAQPKRVTAERPASPLRPIVDQDSDPLLIAKPNPFRKVAIALVVMGALGGASYAAVQNDAVIETAQEIGSSVTDTVTASVDEIAG